MKKVAKMLSIEPDMGWLAMYEGIMLAFVLWIDVVTILEVIADRG